jgi:hypothetical protein
MQMDRQFCTKWRSENKEKALYSALIDPIEDKHLQGVMWPAVKVVKSKKDEGWYEGPGGAG